ncbi:MAG: glutamine-hydrolyzing GMP synthase [Phycisphaerales bacterium]|nr:glutamine-hydrolyzing GMP synthase [Phycisphaerales bacterium]
MPEIVTAQALPIPKLPDRAALPHGEVFVILDFGSQTAQLIARRVREAGAFSLLVSPRVTAQQLRELQPKGIILSGGPASVYEPGAPTCDPAIFSLGIPVLGICYGMQLACQQMGMTVAKAARREFGRAQLHIEDRKDLFGAIPERTAVWMSHGDQVSGKPASGNPLVPSGSSLEILASTETCPLAAIRITSPTLRFYGVQFHPEVTHTPHGVDILRNFLYEVCKCGGSWRMSDFLETEIKRIRARVGTAAGSGVICGLSGGVDSSVCAALLHKAIGDQLQCIFIDTGLLRKNERELVETTFRDHFHIKLKVIDAADQFLNDLKGVTDPTEKRKRIGSRFIRVFEDAQAAMGLHGHNFLAQGTLYPDVIESGHGHAGTSASIKLHHNVGGLPDDLDFELLEPLRDLFKDEVRKLGEVLGLPDQIIWRHPFPGPGLAVRIIGEVTREKLALLQEADEILLEEIVSNNLYRSTSQVFAVLLPVKSVGVMGDGRTYESTIAVRAVETQDFMTADWARIPFDVLANISNRIINEVRGVNRVVYDISSKPPATIEWE